MKNFDYRINSDPVRFKYAKGVSLRTGREFHPYHEIILFLGERAELFSDSGHTPVEANTLIVIPRETYHQLNIVGDPEAYHRCVIDFPDIPALQSLINGSITRLCVSKVSREIEFLFQKLINAANGTVDGETAALLLTSCLPILLSELPREGSDWQSNLPPIAERCLSYIHRHLSEELSVERVARELNVSSSLLSHSFKREMNISFYQYVLKKRLTLAFQRIKEGEPAAFVAQGCGFRDYSNFYRQYKKAFGVAPSGRGA